MSSIPPPTIFSVLQSTTTQRTQSRVQDGDANRRADAARDGATRAEHQADAVESSDADSRVHAEGGGQGGQGRSFDASDEEPTDAPPTETTDEYTPTGRLDLTA